MFDDEIQAGADYDEWEVVCLAKFNELVEVGPELGYSI